MEYYHAGDVIVASDGTLTLRNAVFRLVQTYANEHTIYVDGTANFVIEDSELVSALPIDIIVKGQGTLEVVDSTLTGVNIYATEEAVVKLNGASFNGLLTTSWDSEAYIMIYDSYLVQSPELSGSTVCEITNTSAPSIVVMDDAMAFLYRWIHITVFDGGDYPLEGADVYARFYVNETFWTSSKTDPSGVARLKSLSTILTSSGSTYIGQYRVNASYWSDGVEHVSDSEVSVSVMPYTQPLTENATFEVLLISSVLLPDLSVISDEILTDPEDVVLNGECTIYARVWNYGETAAINTTVDFLVGESLAVAELIGTDIVDTIAAGSFRDASITWVPDVTGLHTIWVVVNGAPDFDERTFNNNNASVVVDVLEYADLFMYPLSFYIYGTTTPIDSAAGGETVTISGYLYNVGEAPVTGISVHLAVVYDSTLDSDDMTITETLEMNDRYLVSFDYTLEVLDADTEIEFTISVNPARSILETSYLNNNQSGVMTILDVRADFSVDVADVYIEYGAEDDVEPIFGNTVTIVALVYNEGGTDPGEINISFGIEGTPLPFAIVSDSFAPGQSHEVRAEYLISLTDGDVYQVYVNVDCNESYWEKNETNNYAAIDFEVIQLEVDITVNAASAEYEADDTMVVTASVVYAGTQTPVKSLRGVQVELVPPDDDEAIVWSEAKYTNSQGMVSFDLRVPATAESGTYTVICSIEGLADTGSATVEIIGTVSGGGIPLLVWIVVIAAIAAVVIGFTAYTYIYGLGKLVECGECGEFIPAASKRCPKCGVEFEAGTMKCSECGAWVPAESTECPNCGVKFVGEELGEEDYLEKMRKEYDEMVSKYRELAKAELGKKFSDKAFEQWWMAQPAYISFDDWLAKEEEKRKETPVACPVCGTLNPKEATVCNKCGTVFAAAAVTAQKRPPQSPPSGGQEPAQAAPAAQPPAEPAQQPAAPRMVIRRPIDRKVVPKKIIKTPLGGQGEGDTQNGENQ
ncbi:MAG: CARDB domain-containing protein [Candidatus Thermoplasmatota archaeon]